MKRHESVLMQLSCWHNITVADYWYLNEGNENYDQLAQKQICNPQPDENATSPCCGKNTES